MYRGRFAPSPTGPLHFGSLVAAVGSFLQARKQHGEWLLRIEDLDTPRVVTGATEAILRTLECYGLFWDGEVRYQSQCTDHYAAAVAQLQEQGLVFPCSCSRQEIAATADRAADGAWIYPGACRNGIRHPQRTTALRVRVGAQTIAFVDLLQGACRQDLAREVGDFPLRRRDGLYAYQLAVVVDDARQGITEVVRGSDLLTSTPRQIYLQQCLRLPALEYRHLPVALDGSGAKLSKQTGAAPLDHRNPVPWLWQVLRFLRQFPPPALQKASLTTLWEWALEHWMAQNIPAQPAIPISSERLPLPPP